MAELLHCIRLDCTDVPNEMASEQVFMKMPTLKNEI